MQWQIGFFGPLFDGMVVSKQILPTLLRATIVQAHKRKMLNPLACGD